MFRPPGTLKNLVRVQFCLRPVPGLGTFVPMSETPLRRYLSDVGKTAEEFAADHELSAWSVRHWSRGDKIPIIETQRRLEQLTGGVVTPAAWLEWSLSRADRDVPPATPAEEAA